MSWFLLDERKGKIETHVVTVFVEELLHLGGYYQDYVWDIGVYLVDLMDVFLSVGVVLLKIMLKLCLLLV